MNRSVSILLLVVSVFATLLLVGEQPVCAQQGLPDPVTIRTILDREGILPGASARLAVVFTIGTGYHLFHHAYNYDEHYTYPITAALELPAGLTALPVRWTKAVGVQDEIDGIVWEYKGEAAALFTVQAAPNMAVGPLEIKIHYGYQTCDDATGTCYPPREGTAQFLIPVLPPETESKPSSLPQFEKIMSDLEPDGWGNRLPPQSGYSALPTTAAPAGDVAPVAAPQAAAPPVAPVGAETETAGDGEDGIAETLGQGFSVTGLLLMYLAGLGSFLLPCIYPMVPITLAYFSRQAAGKVSKTILRAFLYVFGISLSYSALGLVAGLAGESFGAYATHPAVLVPLVVILGAMGLSFLGLFEFRLPDFIMMRISGGAKQGYAGAILMGLMLGIVAAPCVGPAVIALLTVVLQKGDLLFGVFGLMAFAWGMGTPFILLAVFSHSIARMPKSGPWMNAVRELFAFIIFAVALYFLDVMVPAEPFTPIAWGAFFLLSAPFFGLGRTLAEGAGLGARLARGTAYVLVVAGAALLISGLIEAGYLPAASVAPGAAPQTAAQQDGVPWRAYETNIPDLFALARQEGKPVFVDFWASWCKNCKYMLATTFKDPAVIAELAGYIPVKIRAENSKTEGEQVHHTLLQRRYPGQRVPIGYPSYIIVYPSGEVGFHGSGVIAVPQMITVLREHAQKAVS